MTRLLLKFDSLYPPDIISNIHRAFCSVEPWHTNRLKRHTASVLTHSMATVYISFVFAWIGVDFPEGVLERGEAASIGNIDLLVVL